MNLYPEMDAKIVGLLRIGDQPETLYAATLIETLRTTLTESEKTISAVAAGALRDQEKLLIVEKGREHDREQFRQGVATWEKRIADVEKVAGNQGGEVMRGRKMITELKEKCADVEKGAARMKAVADAAIKWREARRAIPDAQLLGDESEDVAFHAYDDAIQKLQRAVSELE